jgi:diphthamide synthase (EF-2-diphthine--ammonia ligase)
MGMAQLISFDVVKTESIKVDDEVFYVRFMKSKSGDDYMIQATNEAHTRTYSGHFSQESYMQFGEMKAEDLEEIVRLEMLNDTQHDAIKLN